MATQPTLLVLGSTSAIGLAIARTYAAEGYGIVLSARNLDQAERDARDIALRYNVSAQACCLDILDTDVHRTFLERLNSLPDVVVCVIGLMHDQRLCEQDSQIANTVMRANYLAPALFLNHVANAFEKRGTGTIIGVSSVAGDRGRASNYIYGSAKAGFTAFLSGLRNRLATKGVHVMTVKPGFVNTRMTAGMKLPKVLTAEPQDIAQAILKGARKNVDVVYAYAVWRWIMLIICHIPEKVFKKLKL